MKDHNLKSTEFLTDEIESIELIGEMPTLDIEVEDTHMFYANDIYTHNSAHEEEIIKAHNVADSFRKVMTGDFVFSLSRKTDDKNSNTSRIHVIKNRFGADGMTFPSTFDASNGTIKLYESSSGEGQELSRKMQSNGDGADEKARQIYNQMSRGKNKNWNSKRSQQEDEE